MNTFDMIATTTHHHTETDIVIGSHHGPVWSFTTNDDGDVLYSGVVNHNQ